MEDFLTSAMFFTRKGMSNVCPTQQSEAQLVCSLRKVGHLLFKKVRGNQVPAYPTLLDQVELLLDYIASTNNLSTLTTNLGETPKYEEIATRPGFHPLVDWDLVQLSRLNRPCFGISSLKDMLLRHDLFDSS